MSTGKDHRHQNGANGNRRHRSGIVRREYRAADRQHQEERPHKLHEQLPHRV
jgi:hypothetical protein